MRSSLIILAAVLLASSVARAAVLDMTGWDSGLNLDGTIEDWTKSGSGTVTLSGAAARNGSYGLRFAATAQANTLCKNYDASLTNRAGLGIAFRVGASSLAIGGLTRILAFNQDSETGGYFELGRGDDGVYTLTGYYLGKESVPYSFGSFTVSTGEWHVALPYQAVTDATPDLVELRWAIYPDTIPLNGGIVSEYVLSLLGNCGGTNCDLKEICLGDATARTYSDIDFDDFVIDDANQLSTRWRVTPLVPTASGSIVEFTPDGCTSGDSNAYLCVDDFTSGGSENSCFDTGTGDQRSRDLAGIKADTFQVTDITLAASETVGAVKVYARGCNDEASSTDVSVVFRDNGGNQAYGSTATWGTSGSAVHVLDGVRETDPTSGAWSESDVDALQVGFRKINATSNGDPAFTAVMAYAGIYLPAPSPDHNMQDWTGDGELTMLGGLDSISAATVSSTCTASGDNGCTRLCDEDGDCGTGATCVDGHCRQACTYPSDCTCAAGATCFQNAQFFHRLSVQVPQVENILVCGQSASTTDWGKAYLPTFISPTPGAGPASDPIHCKLIKGRYGHCSNDSALACDANADCGGGNTCIIHAPDYAIIAHGAGFYLAQLGVSDGLSNEALLSRDGFGNAALPEAATSPSGYQCQSTSCTTNSDCTAISASSVCMNTLASLTPYRPCSSDGGTCSNDAAKVCSWIFTCSNDATRGCAVNGDCTGGGTCSNDPVTTFGPQADAVCTGCTWRDCTTTKRCTCPCDSVPCSTDTDCGPLGGICNTGTSKCRACGRLKAFTGAYDLDTPGGNEAERALQRKKISLMAGSYLPTEIADDVASMRTTVEATGARFITFTYPETFQVDVTPGFRFGWLNDLMGRLRQEFLRFPYVVDLDHLFRYRDNRITGTRYGSLIGDGSHPNNSGSAVAAEGIEGYLENLYPVCSLDTAEPCGYVKVPCVGNSVCDPDGGGANTGLCSGSGPLAGFCTCSTDANCPTGTTCETVASGGAACVGKEISTYPLGTGGTRYLVASTRVCSDLSKGTCTVERTWPRCTANPKTRCTTTAGCTGQLKGDVCSNDAGWRSCSSVADCSDDGAFSGAAPACATTDATNLASQKLCVEQ